MNLLKAAKYVSTAYLAPIALSPVKVLNKNNVEAYFTADRTLVVPGSRDFSDWNRNANLKAVAWDFEPKPGASGTLWHGGFLEHARTLYAFAKEVKPAVIVGHSLGAAASTIVGCSLNIPTIAFATPRPKHRTSNFINAHRVLHVIRDFDPVPDMFFLRLSGYRHIGYRIQLRADKVPGHNHKMPDYIMALKKYGALSGVPEVWPHPSFMRSPGNALTHDMLHA